MRRRKKIPRILLSLALLAATLLTSVPDVQIDTVEAAPPQVTPQLAASYPIRLRVASARTEPQWKNAAGVVVGVTQGSPITTYKFIINQDTSGDPLQSRYPDCSPVVSGTTTPNATYPANCNWPSIHTNDAYNPIIAQGTQADLAATNNRSLRLPPGKYLISVLADGYKIDGTSFSLPLPANTSNIIEVDPQPYPLPLGTVKLQVFEDCNTVNGQYDVPGEESSPTGDATCVSARFKADLPNFEGHLTDVLGVVSNDWFGNPICTTYQTQHGLGQFDANGLATGDPVLFDAAGKPIIQTLGGKCHPDQFGVLTIPNIGPDRYTATVVPPNGSPWVQTTTLEGNHDWDVWVQEGSTGFDTEQIGPNGEAVPSIPFGYVQPTANANNAPITGSSANHGAIKGKVLSSKTYVPQQGGVGYNGQNGQNGVGAYGTKIDKPLSHVWLALTALQGGDRPVYIGQNNADGTFQINNVPNGDYSLTFWDAPQDFLLDTVNVTVTGGQIADMGNLLMSGWWTTYSGKVCLDQNGNGKCDPGEPPIANQQVQLLTRANSTMERGIGAVNTDSQGNYTFQEAYPMTFWLVMQVYSDRFKTVGVTYQADNQPTETTILGNGPDVSVFPVIGLGGRMDWAMQRYNLATQENGGIVGTVTYDTTRNELDARNAVTEVYQPGIPGLQVNLYAPTPCTPVSLTDTTCISPNSDGNYYKTDATGALVKNFNNRILNTYTSEQWERPQGCIPRDVNGQPVVQQVTPVNPAGKDCLEAPFMGVQFQAGFSTVDGNYGFSQSNYDPATGAAYPTPQPLVPGDYIVEVQIPNDTVTGHPKYEVTKEEDVNIFTGDKFVPQVLNPPCAGPLHTVHVTNVDFLAAGGSPYENQQKPLCASRLVKVQTGKASSNNFNLFTQVPIPGKLWGLINDDLNLSTNPQDIMFGEKRGLANVPIGIYDYTNRLITTVMSDPNGFYEVVLPSISSYNCPLPAGPCPNVYRLVGNDPGSPGHLNAYYNPSYRTISASFEVWPGLVIPADHAPTPIGSQIATPGSQNNQIALCTLDTTTPQFFSVDQPYLSSESDSRVITINGTGFGIGAGTVTLAGSSVVHPIINSWSDSTIQITISNTNTTTFKPGPYELTITARNGQTTPTGITFHVLGGRGSNAYNPTIFEVGPGKTYDPNNRRYTFPYTNGIGPIQAALNAAARRPQALVVVYPGTAVVPLNPNGNSLFNANGAYFENLLINSPVKLQGVGPGGIRSDGSTVNGSVVDGLAFGNETYSDAWRTNAAALTWSGNQNLYEGAVITVLGRQGAFTSAYKAAIDGFTVAGGDQMGQNTKANSVPGGVVLTQGGGIFANTYAQNLQITNNLIRSNGGAYGGGIRLGTPFIPGNLSNNINVHIAYNRILNNGGTNLAGGIGIFNGSDNYEIDHNDVCGNYSAEYGGGISQYGNTSTVVANSVGKIHDNRVYFNTSFDEGGGIKIGGEVPANPLTLSPGTGPVDIYNNLIQGNLGNDDGGGIRLLMVNNYPINIYNNMIVNNISTHEGGGIAIDDAPNTRIYNNTIMKNITTATAATSNGQPAPAGVSTTGNNSLLQATLPLGSPAFSNPLLFNNILWDNRAGHWNGVTLQLQGIGLTGDTTPINYWDMGTADNSGVLSPTNSILQSNNHGINASPTNTVRDPLVKATYDLSVAVFPWRTNPNFIGATVVALQLPPNLMGDYHLQSNSSPAYLGGAASVTVVGGVRVNAPTFDYDNGPRPTHGGYDIGADQLP
jgi:hypothetical protein